MCIILQRKDNILIYLSGQSEASGYEGYNCYTSPFSSLMKLIDLLLAVYQ